MKTVCFIQLYPMGYECCRLHYARERSFHRCLSVHRRVGFPACITGHMTRVVCVQGSLEEGLHPSGSAFMGRGSAPGGLPPSEFLPPGGSASRGSASRGLVRHPSVGLPPGGGGICISHRYMGYCGRWSASSSTHHTKMFSCLIIKSVQKPMSKSNSWSNM